ncbi:hypothetical protein SAMN05880570_4287 [Paenibacillus sp. RU4T]|nr:hypothetical protein SAMN05880555_4285 [Paenibacillus sp. RU4X]SIR65868.1 hypothetical protein SAMN05880570_4287 [Paenibacillus sp. RU4T]
MPERDAGRELRVGATQPKDFRSSPGSGMPERKRNVRKPDALEAEELATRPQGITAGPVIGFAIERRPDGAQSQSRGRRSWRRQREWYRAGIACRLLHRGGRLFLHPSGRVQLIDNFTSYPNARIRSSRTGPEPSESCGKVRRSRRADPNSPGSGIGEGKAAAAEPVPGYGCPPSSGSRLRLRFVMKPGARASMSGSAPAAAPDQAASARTDNKSGTAAWPIFQPVVSCGRQNVKVLSSARDGGLFFVQPNQTRRDSK